MARVRHYIKAGEGKKIWKHVEELDNEINRLINERDKIFEGGERIWRKGRGNAKARGKGKQRAY